MRESRGLCTGAAGRRASALVLGLLPLIVPGCDREQGGDDGRSVAAEQRASDPRENSRRVRLQVLNANDDLRVVLHGRFGGEDRNDLILEGPPTEFYLGDAQNAVGNDVNEKAKRNEVIVFCRGHPAKLMEADWNQATIAVPLADGLRIGLRIWIVSGDFDKQRQRAYYSMLYASAMWAEEAMGLDFAWEDVFITAPSPRGSPTPEELAQLVNFAGSDGASGDTMDRYKAAFGFTEGMVNVYYVDTVKVGVDSSGKDVGGTGYGLTLPGGGSGGEVILMGSKTWIDLLCHELGHCFNLSHIDPKAENPEGRLSFGEANVMCGFSKSRRFLTEGQILRAHLDPISAMNKLYKVRENEPPYPDFEFTERSEFTLKRPWSELPLDLDLWGDPIGNEQPPASSRDPVQEVVDRWLETACTVGEEGQIEALRDGPDQAKATKLLIDAFDFELLNELSEVYRKFRAYKRGGELAQQMISGRLEQLEEDPKFKRLREDMDARGGGVRASIREAVRDHIHAYAVADRIHAYRERALLGLAVIGTDAARSKLREVADALADALAPYKGIAKRLLQHR